MNFYTFVYKDKLLPEHCETIGVTIEQIKNIYRRKRRTQKYSRMDENLALTDMLDNLDTTKMGVNYKYYITVIRDGKEVRIPLILFCNTSDEYDYNTILKFISLKKGEDPSRDEDDIIQEYLNTEHRKNRRVFIDNMTLREVCDLYNKDYVAVLQNINRRCKELEGEGVPTAKVYAIVLREYGIPIYEAPSIGDPNLGVKYTLHPPKKNNNKK